MGATALGSGKAELQGRPSPVGNGSFNRSSNNNPVGNGSFNSSSNNSPLEMAVLIVALIIAVIVAPLSLRYVSTCAAWSSVTC